MPDAARVAQAIPLEVPVVLRGAKISPETGKPELFTETARTILVFDNGVVLNIHSRLTVGQTVFIHNTQNAREVMCKVLEAPPDNEPGFTDLEFTTAQDDFWGTNASAANAAAQSESQSAAPAQSPASPESEERAKMRAPSGKPGDDPLAMMLETANKIDVPSMTSPAKESGMPLKEELMSAHEMAPDPNAPQIQIPDFEPAATNDRPASEPTGEQIDAALKQMTSAGAPLPGTEDEGSSDEKHIAALMARDARLAKFAAFKERQQAEKAQGGAKTADSPDTTASAPAKKKSAESKPGTAESSDTEVRTIATKPSIPELLISPKYSKYVMIGACVLFSVAVVFIWHAMRAPLMQPVDPTVAAPPDQPTVASSAAAAVVDAVRSIEQPAPAPKPQPKADTSSAEVRPVQPRVHTPAEGGNFFVPARVVSEPQPTLPPWALDVEVDGVVTLDATIGEDGTVAESRVISGPRPLQKEAQRAVGLWQFEPARQNGRPIASHMTLSVQFLPAPVKPKYPYPPQN